MAEQAKPISEGRSRGGRSRAESLTPKRRSEIARAAANSRWGTPTVKAVAGSADKPLCIGDLEIECYVLEDGTRVLTQASFLRAIGRSSRPFGAQSAVEPLPPFLQGQALKPFLPNDIAESSRRIVFSLPRGGRAIGYNAELLPVVCETYLATRAAGKLPPNQAHVARSAEIIVRGLARVGIIALIDEVTGYQDIRARDALANILEAYIAKDLRVWVQTFPDDFYREMFRLRSLDFRRDSVKRPQYFGHLTNDVIYRRLAPGVLDELKRVQRRTDDGKPKDKLFQRLTANVGYPKLREHLGSVVTLMKLSTDWRDFKVKLDQIHPRVGDTIPLPFDMGDENTGL
jgi:hypothetical protein